MKIPKHTSLSLGGNVPMYEHSNKERSRFYDKPDISLYSALSQQGGKKKDNQVGKGFWADVLGGAVGGLGAIVGSVGGPIGSGALGAAAAYGGKKFFEQQGLGYQYKSGGGARGMWVTSNNSLGAVSQNMITKL
jgi:hypothetical protein